MAIELPPNPERAPLLVEFQYSNPLILLGVILTSAWLLVGLSLKLRVRVPRGGREAASTNNI